MLPTAACSKRPSKAGHGEWLLFTSKRYLVDSFIRQQRDVNEGADIIMVKPALPYLDIISDAVELASDHPIACYQVSGEFAMIHAGAAAGVYDLRAMAFETAESMVRAGATLILSYFTPQFLEWL
jgi:porphobilinogen synthase